MTREELVEETATQMFGARNGLDGDTIGTMIYEDFRIDGDSKDAAMRETMIVFKMAAEAALTAIEAHIPVTKILSGECVVVAMEPSAELYEAWRSVNCHTGDGGMEEFTTFHGDYGNWLTCHQAMLAAAKK